MTQRAFHVNTEQTGTTFAARPVGELDVATVERLERAIATRDPATTQLVIDLRELEFIDSTGLRLLISQAQACAQDGCELRIVRGPEVARFLEIASADRFLPLVDG